MKRVLICFFMLLALISVCGCQQNEEEKSQNEDQKFTQQLQDNNWQADIMGVSGTVDFDDGTGTVTVDGYGTHTFDYKISDISDDGNSAKITVNNSGIEQIDGQSVSVKVVDDGLEVSYLGMTYVLTPAP